MTVCKVEYMALAVAIQKEKFLIQWLIQMKTSMLYLFWQSGNYIGLTKDQSSMFKTRWCFIKSDAQNSTIKLDYISSEENVADYLQSLSPE